VIESEVSVDGTAILSLLSRGLTEHDSAGVFDFAVTDDAVRVRLSEEACRMAVYTPRRSSQFLAALKPWEPIRVVLKRKADWSSGRYYYLLDYHLVLCDAALSFALLPVRIFDYQADLI
jgi:hypothetical protein